MQIKANVRPRGLKKGVTTKKLYALMGLKDSANIDIRDVVGTLELSASGPNDTLFLNQIYRCLGLYNPTGMYIEVRDKDGTLLSTTKGQQKEEGQ